MDNDNDEYFGNVLISDFLFFDKKIIFIMSYMSIIIS